MMVYDTFCFFAKNSCQINGAKTPLRLRLIPLRLRPRLQGSLTKKHGLTNRLTAVALVTAAETFLLSVRIILVQSPDRFVLQFPFCHMSIPHPRTCSVVDKNCSDVAGSFVE
jgi:hypothetical protein